MDPKKVGELIHEARICKNMTQKDLAVSLHITDKAVSKWERGLSIPDISLLIPISNILDISVYDLLGGKMNVDKISKEDAEQVVKTTIEKGVQDGKWKNRIKNIIIAILSTIVICGLVIGGISLLLRYWNYKDYLLTNQVTYNNYNITYAYHKYHDKLALDLKNEEDEIINAGNDCYDLCLNYFLQNELPLNLNWRSMPIANDERNTITYLYSDSTKSYQDEMKDNTYIKKGIIINSVKSFLIIQNLEHIKYLFEDQTYTVAKSEVIQYFTNNNIAFDQLINYEIWNKQIINKIENNNKNFINNFPIVIEKTPVN